MTTDETPLPLVLESLVERIEDIETHFTFVATVRSDRQATKASSFEFSRTIPTHFLWSLGRWSTAWLEIR